MKRRDFLQAVPSLATGALLPCAPWMPTISASPSGVQPPPGSRLRITGLETFVVRATHRTNWIIVRLNTNQGLTGLGEASLGRQTSLPELDPFFSLVQGESPFLVEQYRQRGLAEIAAENATRQVVTAFSAIEQALWDLVGKALDTPAHVLLGGKLRDRLPVYANINRATAERTPEGFAEKAAAAISDGNGFLAIKAAPFDGFPALTEPTTVVNEAKELGISCVEAMREAVGPDVAIKIDCHSFFDVELAVEVARRLEPQQLSWYEEPVAPTMVDDTLAIRDAVRPPLAGGEFLFGMAGFDELCRRGAVDIIMPDVKHCGGLQEARSIAALAALHGVAVSPHNPSGPVATFASAHLCAGMPNFDILEYQWGEVSWRGDLVEPPERFDDGNLAVPDGPGFGITLNDRLVAEHAI